MPWHYAIENKLFTVEGINLEWTDFPGGTGSMANALKNNDLDMAVMLTEGAIVDIENGANNSILGFYVNTSLAWGIHVAANSEIQIVAEIASKRFAVSRVGSGSHLMALVNAAQNNQTIAENQFVIVHNIDGAVQALTTNQADIFLWEKFMTAKFVQSGMFRRIGEIPTPWPSFVLVARDDVFQQHIAEINTIQDVMGKLNANFKYIPRINQMIADKYKLPIGLVAEWIETVEWNNEIKFDPNQISNVKAMLTKLKII